MRAPDFILRASFGTEARTPRATSASALGLALTLALLLALLLAGCGDAGEQDGRVSTNTQNAAASNTSNASAPAGTAAKSEDGSIKADPNPVPAGAGNGRTKVSWNTKGDLAGVEVHVSENGQPEVLFAKGGEGSTDAPWIQTGSNYEFRLYAGVGRQRRLIDKVQVSRAQ